MKHFTVAEIKTNSSSTRKSQKIKWPATTCLTQSCIWDCEKEKSPNQNQGRDRSDMLLLCCWNRRGKKGEKKKQRQNTSCKAQGATSNVAWRVGTGWGWGLTTDGIGWSGSWVREAIGRTGWRSRTVKMVETGLCFAFFCVQHAIWVAEEVV